MRRQSQSIKHLTDITKSRKERELAEIIIESSRRAAIHLARKLIEMKK